MSRKDQGPKAQMSPRGSAHATGAGREGKSADGIAVVSLPMAGQPAPGHDRAADIARRYRALAEVAGQILWTTTADGALSGDFTSWCAFTGQRKEEARGQGWLAAVHPNDRAAVAAAWAEAVTQRSRYVHEHRIRRHNGVYCDMLVRGVPVFADDGRLLEWVGVCIDITERKRLERRTGDALAALLEMASVMVSPIPVADAPSASESPAHDDEPSATIRALVTLCCQVLTCDHIAFVTFQPASEVPRDALILGSTRKQEVAWRRGLTGLRLEDRFDAASCARLRSGEAVLIEVARLPAGDPAPILSSRVFLLAPMLVGGRLAGYFGAKFGDHPRDYTPENVSLTLAVAQLVGIVIERERLLVEREEARGNAFALQEVSRRMDEFLSVASHEMRTPLTVIKTHLQVFARDCTQPVVTTAASGLDSSAPAAPGGSASPFATIPRDRQVRMLDRMQHQVARLERLIGDLLDASRLKSGELKLRVTDQDPVALVRQIVEEQRIVDPERTITLTHLPVADGWPLIRMDCDRIGQVLTNYLTNALKYSPADMPIAVRVESYAGQIRVAVHDQGPGISTERQALVWERFQRLPEVQAQSGSAVGLGLGLYISREIVERHGGRVGVESVPGSGSIFWFTLPTDRV